jgi:hypothetical protein
MLLYVLGVGHSTPVEFAPQWALHWLVVEFSIIWLGVIVSNLLMWNWVKRPNRIKFLLSLMLMTYAFSLLLVFLRKVWWRYFTVAPIDQNTYFGAMIYEYRFSLALSGLAAWIFYSFYLAVFKDQEEVKPFFKFLVHSITVIAVVAQFLYPNTPSELLNMVISGLVLVQSLVILVPIFYYSVRLVKQIKEPDVKFVFLFLSLIALSYILILLSYVLSIVWDAITGGHTGPFYVAQQVFTLITIINGYLGFVAPRWFRKFVSK